MGWLVYDSIFSVINEAEAIKKAEKKVVEKLKQIRKAEVAYFNKYKTYTADWDSLVTFIKEDTIYTVERTEIITPRTKNDPLYYTRTDSVRIEEDTIGRELAIKKLFPIAEYPNFNPERLPYLPGRDTATFEIWADTLRKGQVLVNAIEVVDSDPRDPTRNDNDERRVRWRLRFGSKYDATTSGNWE
ncbi:hypothetical protein GCM10023331_19250 [Algivirga pacifica]|uniref:Uncharacterized protein n=2 Tax=Algivirga pacifica TaxID=1162670 RepID=A0ABP9D9X6_9BACT